MKKIQIFIGSPRKKGNTSLMAEELVKYLDADRYEMEITHLYDYQINPCVDCKNCKRGNLICKVKDGMQEIYPKVEEADLFIIGTPVYWFGPSGQTKNMLDRFRPYYENEKLHHKRAALLIPAGAGNRDCDLTIEMFKRSFEALEIEFIGAVTAEAYDEGDVLKDPQTMGKDGTEQAACLFPHYTVK